MTPLENKIWTWMLEDLSEPRQEFNDLPICPFIHQYHTDIQVIEINHLDLELLEDYLQKFHWLNYKALVLATPNNTIDELEQITEVVLNQEQNSDIEILINDHTLKGTIRNVYTGFDQCDLVIIQHKSLLKQARLDAKKMGYYE